MAVACKKDKNENTGGKGGNAELRVTPYHHNLDTNQIYTCTVYIKYNTRDMPANRVYDDSAVCTRIGDSSIAVFSGLKKGDYYLFGKGYDPKILQDVEGGKPYTISNETVQSVPLPVTEGD